MAIPDVADGPLALSQCWLDDAVHAPADPIPVRDHGVRGLAGRVVGPGQVREVSQVATAQITMISRAITTIDHTG